MLLDVTDRNTKISDFMENDGLQLRLLSKGEFFERAQQTKRKSETTEKSKQQSSKRARSNLEEKGPEETRAADPTPSAGPSKKLRPIIIDGSNVARA